MINKTVAEIDKSSIVQEYKLHHRGQQQEGVACRQQFKFFFLDIFKFDFFFFSPVVGSPCMARLSSALSDFPRELSKRRNDARIAFRIERSRRAREKPVWTENEVESPISDTKKRNFLFSKNEFSRANWIQFHSADQSAGSREAPPKRQPEKSW